MTIRLLALMRTTTDIIDETLIRQNLATIANGTLGFRISSDHYRYLAERIIALRAVLAAIEAAGSLSEAKERARMMNRDMAAD